MKWVIWRWTRSRPRNPCHAIRKDGPAAVRGGGTDLAGFPPDRSKKHYLTIEYNDQSGEAHSVIVRLNKRNARKVVATATAQTSKSVAQIEEK